MLNIDFLGEEMTRVKKPMGTIQGFQQSVWEGTLRKPKDENGKPTIEGQSFPGMKLAINTDVVIIFKKTGKHKKTKLTAYNEYNLALPDSENIEEDDYNTAVTVSTLKDIDYYNKVDWDSAQTLRYLEARNKKQQNDWRNNPQNFAYELIVGLDANAKLWFDLFDDLNEGETITDKLKRVAPFLTIEQAIAERDKWRELMTVLEPLGQFVITNNLTAAMNQDLYLAEDKRSMKIMILAALNLESSSYLDDLPHAKLANIYKQLIPAVESSDLPPLESDSEPVPLTDDEKKPSDPGQQPEQKLNPSSDTPTTLSEPEPTQSMTAEDTPPVDSEQSISQPERPKPARK
jgi:hypothetical protein